VWSSLNSKRMFRALVLLGLAGAFACAVGFLRFTSVVMGYNAEPTGRADGIVVLTGGELRIAEGLRMLESGHAKRLLVSGVHPSTSKDALRRSMQSKRRAVFECCVDMGYKAADTLGNALEARDWAQQYGFRSLLVVTSNFHMPRSLVELGRALPNVELIPFAVVHKNLPVEVWWTHPRTAVLLAYEYAKYVRASLRAWINGDLPPLAEPSGMPHPERHSRTGAAP
jgi:uncharacterized SAM-binding protein YcdF (DUF218 family)